MGDTRAGASSVTLPGGDGDRTGVRSLAEYPSSGVAVPLWYSFDFSPVSTSRRCAFRDSGLLGLSCDADETIWSSWGPADADENPELTVVNERVTTVLDDGSSKTGS